MSEGERDPLVISIDRDVAEMIGMGLSVTVQLLAAAESKGVKGAVFAHNEGGAEYEMPMASVVGCVRDAIYLLGGREHDAVSPLSAFGFALADREVRQMPEARVAELAAAIVDLTPDISRARDRRMRRE